MIEKCISTLHAANRHAWNQAAIAYKREMEDTIRLLKEGATDFCAPELEVLKNLNRWCHTAIHLQCADGKDSLSLLNLGAERVIGIDISEQMIHIAQALSDRLAAAATWICRDVIDPPEELYGTADLVYTGKGAVIWTHDLKRWATSVFRLLKPGGTFYLFEGHPITYCFDAAATEIQLAPEFESYFSERVYSTKGWTAEYVGDVGVQASDLGEKFERTWPVSEVINALLGTGLRLERFEEHPDAYWKEFPHLPDSERRRFPNTYSLLMRKTKESGPHRQPT